MDIKTIIYKIGAIGRSPSDSEEEKLKTLLIAFSGIMGALAIFWGALYFYCDEIVAALIPWSYTVISIISLLVFNRNKSYKVFRISNYHLA